MNKLLYITKVLTSRKWELILECETIVAFDLIEELDTALQSQIYVLCLSVTEGPIGPISHTRWCSVIGRTKIQIYSVCVSLSLWLYMFKDVCWWWLIKPVKTILPCSVGER